MESKKTIKFISILLVSLSFSFCTTEPVEKTPTNFGWEISTPKDANLNTQLIETGINKAAKQKYINSVLIVKNKKIVTEKYFHGYTQNSAQIVRSVSKSFLSATYGIAVEKSVLSIDDKIMNYLSEYSESVIDNRFNSITVLNLLKMKGGLESDKTSYFKVFRSNNWLQTIFSMGLKYSPGTKFSYSTPGAHLLSVVLTEATGGSSKEFVETNLISPMGITLEKWEKDPQGFYFGGNNMYFTARNMASFGLLYMNNGKLNGKQIVPEDWVKKSLTDYSGLTGNWGDLKNVGYGLFWWLGEMDNKKVFTALGHGGQFIMCVPSLDMIIVTTANSYIYSDEANVQEEKIMEIMSEYFLPAAN